MRTIPKFSASAIPAPWAQAANESISPEGENAGEYAVTSAIALFRNRFDIPTYDILIAKREDIIRRIDAGLRIAKRTILLDRAALGGSASTSSCNGRLRGRYRDAVPGQ